MCKCENMFSGSQSYGLSMFSVGPQGEKMKLSISVCGDLRQWV